MAALNMAVGDCEHFLVGIVQIQFLRCLVVEHLGYKVEEPLDNSLCVSVFTLLVAILLVIHPPVDDCTPCKFVCK